MKTFFALSTLFLFSLAVGGCAEPEEAPRVDLPVQIAPAVSQTVTTNENYTVELEEARIAVSSFSFTVAGESHSASMLESIAGFLIREAHAHPGHLQNGVTTGALDGNWIADFSTADVLGQAKFITGQYESANFGLGRAGEVHSLSADDPMHGHTAQLELVVRRGDETWQVRVLIDSPEDRLITGAPFDASIGETTKESVHLRFEPYDRFEDDTLFDDVNFALLDGDSDGMITIGPEATDAELVDAYNRIRRAFQSHDHFSFELK